MAKNYSAALTLDGELYAWGSKGRAHGGGNHILYPRQVDATSGCSFSFVACGESHLVAFAPTGVRELYPSAGPVDGGTQLTIYVDGVGSVMSFWYDSLHKFQLSRTAMLHHLEKKKR